MAFIEVVLMSLEVGFAGENRIFRREYGKNNATGCFFFGILSCFRFSHQVYPLIDSYMLYASGAG